MDGMDGMNDMDMQMGTRIPDWLTPVAWVYIALSLLTAIYLATDIYRRRSDRPGTVQGLVWIASALYLGPFALLPYHRYGRAEASEASEASKASEAAGPVSEAAASDQPTVVAGLPGGGASAVAHLIGVPLVLASGLTIAGLDLWVMIIVIGLLASALLFVYERLTSARAGTAMSIGAAATAAVLTVLAFDVGMGGWMLLLHFNELMPAATEGSFWFLMQVGILLGLLTGYPVVKWLSQRRQGPATA